MPGSSIQCPLNINYGHCRTVACEWWDATGNQCHASLGTVAEQSTTSLLTDIRTYIYDDIIPKMNTTNGNLDDIIAKQIEIEEKLINMDDRMATMIELLETIATNTTPTT